MKIEVRLTWGPSNQRIGLKKIQLCLKLFWSGEEEKQDEQKGDVEFLTNRQNNSGT